MGNEAHRDEDDEQVDPDGSVVGVNDHSYENSTATYELASHPYDFKVRI